MATERGEGKTGFVEEVLTRNERANTKAVNVAWKAAGHEGTISPSLVKNVRAKLGLTGNIRKGRKRVLDNGAVLDESPAATEVKTQATSARKRAAKPSPRPKRKQGPVATQAPQPQPQGAARASVLVHLESEIDELIHEVKGAGGLPEFEETLRKARRILARSHAE